MTAAFTREAFSAHRHDTYGIGITTRGVQAFHYRGQSRRSSIGHVFVLHPDELHDGHAGDERGYAYQIAYIEPSLILAASDGRGLPFIATPVLDAAEFRRAVEGILVPADEMEMTSAVVELTDALWQAAGTPRQAERHLRLGALNAVRDALLAAGNERILMIDLEKIAGLSRWELARQFRRAFGVSPYRFHLMRRLEEGRRQLGAGSQLALVAIETGFSDQAHFSRHFRAAYGMSPGRWRLLTTGSGA
jgi:AraC-like DNA-binding protein